MLLSVELASALHTARSSPRIAFLLYDHLLTFRDELRFAWIPTYMTKGTYLFLFLRYFVPFSSILEAVAAEVHISPEVRLFSHVWTCFRLHISQRYDFSRFTNVFVAQSNHQGASGIIRPISSLWSSSRLGFVVGMSFRQPSGPDFSP